MASERDDRAAATVAGLLERRADDDGASLRFEGATWSWRQVVAEARVRAALLDGHRSDGPVHVGALLDNTADYLFFLAGAALAGAVVVGLNPTRRGEELARDFRATDCVLLVTDTDHLDLVRGLDLGVGPDRVLTTDTDEHRELLAGMPSGWSGPPPAPDDLYLLVFTSGSTGTPKAVRMSQGRAARAALRMPFTPDDILYSAMPLFHGNALSSSVFPWMASGATLVLRRRFSASGFLPDVREHGATFVNTVGRAVAHILATEPTGHDRDHRLRYVLGPETSGPDKAEFTRRFGVPLFEGYGSSEGAIVLNPVGDDHPGALGRLPRGAEAKVVDPATGEERPAAVFDDRGRLTNPGQAIGELIGRSPHSAFEGYYKNPEAEAERLRDGWYWSGDLAYRDGDGIFYFAGRSGDWLRVDSENFTAAPIERILGRLPGLRGVAVYGVPDSRTGDQVMAALELDDPVRFDPRAFAAFLAGQPDLGTKWAPRYVRLVASLPVTGTDKIDKAPLRAEQWSAPDPYWHRIAGREGYVPMTSDDIAALRAEFVHHGRDHLLAP
ncbi:MAG: AMP-binding protein [Acidimicrobiales bacterium]|jgi:fatty-acyl-CoA synthase